MYSSKNINLITSISKNINYVYKKVNDEITCCNMSLSDNITVKDIIPDPSMIVLLAIQFINKDNVIKKYAYIQLFVYPTYEIFRKSNGIQKLQYPGTYELIIGKSLNILYIRLK